MAIYHKEIARQLVDLVDTFVKDDDPNIKVMQAFEDLFSKILESATPRPIWQWRNFCKAVLKEMFPKDADSFQPRRVPPQTAPELSVHKNETVIPFLIDLVMDGVLFYNKEQVYQEFASKILDEVFNNELLVAIRSSQSVFEPLDQSPLS